MADWVRNLTGFVTAHRLAIFVFCALVTAFLWNVLFTDRSLSSFDIILSQPSWQEEYPTPQIHQPILIDSPTAHYPQRRLEWGTLKNGKNISFNPYIFLGMPTTAQGVGAFITSLPQLYLDVADAIDWTTWLRLILAAFFMYLLLAELGLGRAAGIFGGILWILNLHQIVWLEFPQHLATQIWIPLVFLGNLLILRHGFRVRWVVGLIAVNVLFFTSGYVQIVLYTYIALGLFNTLYLILATDYPAWGDRAKTWFLLHCVHVAAIVFYGVGVYSEVQFISEGLRGVQEWRGYLPPPEWSPAELLRFFSSLIPPAQEVTHLYTPDYYGGVWEGRYRHPYGNIVENGHYIGVLGLVFFLYALVSAWRARDWRLRATIVVVLGVLFAFMYKDPIAVFFLQLIPFTDKGTLSRFLTLIVFLTSIVSAIGFNGFLKDVVESRVRWFWATMGLFVAIPFLSLAAIPEFKWEKLVYSAVVSGLFAAVVLLTGYKQKLRLYVGVSALIILAADLFYAGYGFNTRMDNERIFPTNNTVRFLLNDPSSFRIAVVSKKPLYHPNILSYYRIPTVEGYSTVLPNAYRMTIARLFAKHHITANGILFILEPNLEALRLMNVKYILSDQELSAKDERFERVLESNDHAIFRIRDWLPRVYCPSHILEQDKKEKALGQYHDAMKALDRPVIIRDAKRYKDGAVCRVDDVKVFIDSVTFNVHADDDYAVFLPYSYNRNWRAEVNGEPVEILRANGTFIAVPLARGRSQVRVYYDNNWAAIAAWIVIAGAMLILIYVFLSRRRGVMEAGLLAVALLAMGKSAMSLPFIRNDRIPERPVLDQPFGIERLGVVRPDRARVTTPILEDKPLVFPLDVPTLGLTRIGLLAGTFLQPYLDYDVHAEVIDGNDRVIAATRIKGRTIGDNRWFFADIPTLKQEYPGSRLALSTSNSDPKQAFALWRGDDGRVSIKAFYELGSGAAPSGARESR